MTKLLIYRPRGQAISPKIYRILLFFVKNLRKMKFISYKMQLLSIKRHILLQYYYISFKIIQFSKEFDIQIIFYILSKYVYVKQIALVYKCSVNFVIYANYLIKTDQMIAFKRSSTLTCAEFTGEFDYTIYVVISNIKV